MIAIGSDHAGYQLKKAVTSCLDDMNIRYKDFGTNGDESVDFPDYAFKVSESVVNNQCTHGILICGTGIGMSIAANKIPGIRAALCTNIYQAEMSKLHNNANILVLAGRITAEDYSIEILKKWLGTDFLGGKYESRNIKIKNIEQLYTGGK